MQAADLMRAQRYDVVNDILLPSGLRHGDGNLIKLAYLRLLFACQPRRDSLTVFTTTCFCICAYLSFVVDFPYVSVFTQYMCWPNSRVIYYGFTVFLIPLVLTVFNIFTSVVLTEVISTCFVALGPLNLQAFDANPFGFACGYMPVLARLSSEIVPTAGFFSLFSGFG